MTPYTLKPDDMPIYKGAKWSHTLLLEDPNGVALDLTGLGPFVLQFEKQNGTALVAATTVVDADPTTGVVTVSLTAAQTGDLPIDTLCAGLRDSQNNPYFQGFVPVRKFSPAPAE